MAITHLILGGARSGKSNYAEQTAKQYYQNSNHTKLIYLATASREYQGQADKEMASRITHHQASRSNIWTLIEEPVNISQIILNADQQTTILVECLTLWLMNCLAQTTDDTWLSTKQLFLESIARSKATLVMVGNEVGSGIVPMGVLSRTFVDQGGWLHQELAAACDHVSLVVAGLPMALKSQ